MLNWFLHQQRADKIAVLLAAAVVTSVLWTAIASYMLIALLGASARQHYPLSDPTTYYQWWVFFDAPALPARTHLWLLISGVAAAVPFGAFLLRQVMDYLGAGPRPSVYGKTQWADQKQMKAANIATRKRPF